MSFNTALVAAFLIDAAKFANTAFKSFGKFTTLVYVPLEDNLFI